MNMGTIKPFIGRRKKADIQPTFSVVDFFWLGPAAPKQRGAAVGSIKRPDGRMQVTYNGLALYRYSDDHAAGQLKGQGEEGIWFAVTPAGTVTRTHVESSPPAEDSGQSSGSSSGSPGGSYNY